MAWKNLWKNLMLLQLLSSLKKILGLPIGLPGSMERWVAWTTHTDLAQAIAGIIARKLPDPVIQISSALLGGSLKASSTF